MSQTIDNPVYRNRLEARLWPRVNKIENGCWEWTGTSNKGGKGYGRICYRGVSAGVEYVHRIVYQLAFGAIPDGLHVLHTCDNPKCCRPDHLFLGTQQENTDDMREKRRHRHGSTHTNSKLNESEVAEIYMRYGYDTTQQDLADEFGVDKETIGDIIRGNTWGWLTSGLPKTKRFPPGNRPPGGIASK